jgi:hypothetical protein
MSNTFHQRKQDLINLIVEIEDESVLEEALSVYITKNRKEPKEIFDFEKEWNRGITSEDLKKKVIKHIESLPWKK